MHRSDRELADAFTARGDEEAFRVLFRRHTPRLYATALRLTGGDRRDADDAVQMMWVRGAGLLHAFEWRSALTTWLTGILINCARELRRAHPEREVTADRLQDQPTPATSGQAIDLERAIAALPDGYRDVLVLHDVEGLTHDEVGAALGISTGTSKSQLFHARRAVRRWLTTGDRT